MVHSAGPQPFGLFFLGLLLSLLDLLLGEAFRVDDSFWRFAAQEKLWHRGALQMVGNLLLYVGFWQDFQRAGG